MTNAIENAIKRDLMIEICTADSVQDSWDLFGQCFTLLEGCQFVFAAKRGGTPGLAVNRTFSAGAAVRSLFSTEKVIVLDQTTYTEMLKGPATFAIDYSISLDTATLSYLTPYIDGNHAKIPADFQEVFEFIAAPGTKIDPTPYRLENQFNITGNLKQDRDILEKLKGYEVLRALDLDALARGEVRSYLKKEVIARNAKRALISMYRDKKEAVGVNEMRQMQQIMYCILLKTYIIQFTQGGRTANNKITALSEFLDQHLGAMFARELVIARSYFERGQRFPFFGEVMVKGKELFQKVRAMSWDLWHVRWLELAMALRPSDVGRYFFSALLTCDKKLVEVMDIHPLKAWAHKNGCKPMPFFDGDVIAKIIDGEPERLAYTQRFYALEAVERRHGMKDQVRDSLDALVNELEREFSTAAKI